MEGLRLGVQSELQPVAYATATAMPDPSRVCNLHHSSRQCQILDPLSKARDRTCILMGASRVLLRHNKNSLSSFLKMNSLYTVAWRDLKRTCWAKEAEHKNYILVWFYLYEKQKPTKLIPLIEIKMLVAMRNLHLLPVGPPPQKKKTLPGLGGRIDSNSHRELSGGDRNVLCLFLFFFVFCLFRAAPTAYGGSQARCPFGAVAASLHHSSQQYWILNPLSEAGDRTCNFMVPSRIC